MQSFGPKGSNTKSGFIPNAVKQFMTQQNATVNVLGENSAIKEEQNIPDISKFTSTTTKENSPLSLFESNTKSSISRPRIGISNAFFNSQLPKKLDSSQNVLNLEKKSNIIASKPTNTLLLSIPGQNGAMIPTASLAAAVEATNKEVDLSSLLPMNGHKTTETKLTGEELAAEEFMASLANPVFNQMPVDKSLVAALNSMAGRGNEMISTANKNIVLPSIQKRSLLAKSKENAFKNKHRSRITLKTQYKREANKERRIIKSDKPIERSNMVQPLIGNTQQQQGPKLLDKIRDMGRVIAKP